MKIVIRVFEFLFLLFAFCYLIVAAPIFPSPPPGSLRSNEPGDLESVYRRAYFTNLSRSEVLSYYSQQFKLSIPIQILLNYPPEDAATFIRDQTKSSWLQEIVHPFRESLLINGFYPTKPTEQINIDGIHYLNKITLRYLPSSTITRLTVMSIIILCGYLVSREYARK